MLAGSALLAGCFTMILVQYGLEEILQHKDSPVVRGGEARVSEESLVCFTCFFNMLMATMLMSS